MKEYFKKNYGALALGWVLALVYITLINMIESVILKIALINAG